ncbi:MAG: N-methyl-L-tryptophan oxidase [Pirellulaceae bacterium]|nr:N-methyl-L-tryptophan oxidase [Pirellulaceae bacterium]
MATEVFDVIVLGTGGVGSAAAYHLARRGARVLGLDRFPGGHDRGSSHGQTRIIRQAYFEHSDYVPLLIEAYRLWRELEQSSGETLLRQVGLLQVGPAGGAVIGGVLASAKQHGLAVESLAAGEIERRWPGFRVPEQLVGVLEPAAGYLHVERCVLAHLAAAQEQGADLRFGSAARSWRGDGGGVTVETEDGQRYSAAKLVVTAGPWASQVLAGLGVPLVVRRKHLYWFPAGDSAYQADKGYPTFLFELPHGVFYGFPKIDDLGLKVAEHSGGAAVADPLTDPRAFDAGDLARVEGFLAAHLPRVGRPHTCRGVCFYTMSPDEHFLVDQLPGHDNVVFAAGLSGHGFKFTSVLGPALADLALDGQTRLPIGFLGVGRFGK